jgi:hypothetical protein
MLGTVHMSDPMRHFVVDSKAQQSRSYAQQRSQGLAGIEEEEGRAEVCPGVWERRQVLSLLRGPEIHVLPVEEGFREGG